MDGTAENLGASKMAFVTEKPLSASFSETDFPKSATSSPIRILYRRVKQVLYEFHYIQDSFI